jgi:hypothetical protein
LTDKNISLKYEAYHVHIIIKIIFKLLRRNHHYLSIPRFINQTIMMKLLFAAFLATTTFASKIRGVEQFEQVGPIAHDQTNADNFIQIINKNNVCFDIAGCNTYQVNNKYFGYGCGECEPEYILIEDIYTVGICIKSEEPKNCVVKAQDPFRYFGQPFCYRCETGYYLSSDSLECIKRKKKSNIKHCTAYSADGSGDISCQACKTGYTLNDDGKCKKGVKVAGCLSGEIIEGKHVCSICDRNTIGVYDLGYDVFSECLTCNEFQCKAASPIVRETCDKKGKDCEQKQE